MTNTEIKILNTLWENARPMSATEILRQNPEMKEITVRKALKTMLDEKFLRVEGITQTTKNFARTFTPIITKEQYTFKEISKIAQLDVFQFTSALLEKENLSDGQLSRLRSIIDKRLEK
ncbi:BlaI/MecI/CopY family transcriptional regulator [Blautia schinkii]|nr:BlaI/MecI/CopY family transcriptional regulator [Blautia schinkii]